MAAIAPLIRDDEIYAVTARANRELKAAGTSLTAAELQVLVLVDGFSSVKEIAERAPGMDRVGVEASLYRLATGKLIVSTNDVDAMGSGFSTIAVPAGFFSGIGDVNHEADGGASILKQTGYFVRISRRALEGRRSREAHAPTILVIDDDEELQKLVKYYCKMDGFTTRSALKAEDIVAALRQQPLPDAILLDVNLPDANGFDILDSLRRHPVLKAIPVVMFTAEATREAVLRGLHGGADGYVTKPFEQDQLISAVKAVLGLLPPREQKK